MSKLSASAKPFVFNPTAKPFVFSPTPKVPETPSSQNVNNYVENDENDEKNDSDDGMQDTDQNEQDEEFDEDEYLEDGPPMRSASFDDMDGYYYHEGQYYMPVYVNPDGTYFDPSQQDVPYGWDAPRGRKQTSFKSHRRWEDAYLPDSPLMVRRDDLRLQQDLHLPRLELDAYGMFPRREPDNRIRYDMEFLMSFSQDHKQKPGGFPLDFAPILKGPEDYLAKKYNDARREAKSTGRKKKKYKARTKSNGPSRLAGPPAEGSGKKKKKKGRGNRYQSVPDDHPMFDNLDLELHPTENRWVHKKAVDEKAVCIATLRAVLNKLVPETFDKLVTELLALEIASASTMEAMIGIIYDTSINEVNFAPMYAELCAVMAANSPVFVVGKGQNDQVDEVSFHTLLLAKCYCNLMEQDVPDQISKLAAKKQIDMDEAALIIKDRRKANIVLMGELFKQGLLARHIICLCIDMLLDDLEDPDVENLCILLTSTAPLLEKNEHLRAAQDAKEGKEPRRSKMREYFRAVAALSRGKRLPARLRFMVLDLLDFRRRGYVLRMKKTVDPKKLKDVRQEVPSTPHDYRQGSKETHTRSAPGKLRATNHSAPNTPFKHKLDRQAPGTQLPVSKGGYVPPHMRRKLAEQQKQGQQPALVTPAPSNPSPFSRQPRTGKRLNFNQVTPDQASPPSSSTTPQSIHSPLAVESSSPTPPLTRSMSDRSGEQSTPQHHRKQPFLSDSPPPPTLTRAVSLPLDNTPKITFTQFTQMETPELGPNSMLESKIMSLHLQASGTSPEIHPVQPPSNLSEIESINKKHKKNKQKKKKKKKKNQTKSSKQSERAEDSSWTVVAGSCSNSSNSGRSMSSAETKKDTESPAPRTFFSTIASVNRNASTSSSQQAASISSNSFAFLADDDEELESDDVYEHQDDDFDHEEELDDRGIPYYQSEDDNEAAKTASTGDSKNEATADPLADLDDLYFDEEPEETPEMKANTTRLEKAYKSIESLVAEFYNCYDVNEACLCVDDLLEAFHKARSDNGENDSKEVAQSLLDNVVFPRLVSTSITSAFEQSDRHRELCDNLFVKLIEKKKLPVTSLTKGIGNVVKVLRDLSLDTPRAPAFLGQFLGRAIANDLIGFQDICRILDPLSDDTRNTSAVQIAVKALHEIREYSNQGEAALLAKFNLDDATNYQRLLILSPPEKRQHADLVTLLSQNDLDVLCD